MKHKFFCSVAIVSLLTLALSGCRGAPCGSYGNCGGGGYPGYGGGGVAVPGGTYVQPAPGFQNVQPPPGVGVPVQPGAVLQPGVQYQLPPGQVAPQQFQPGAIVGG